MSMNLFLGWIIGGIGLICFLVITSVIMYWFTRFFIRLGENVTLFILDKLGITNKSIVKVRFFHDEKFIGIGKIDLDDDTPIIEQMLKQKDELISKQKQSTKE